MITHLHITNYALIDDMELSPRDGLNIITGETGAGKSIILGAISLLRGARADMRAIADRNRKSVVEAFFSTSETTRNALAQLMSDSDIDDPDGESVILRRELLPSGRSRAFINDTPVTLTTLGTVADRLIDIHSQHKNLLLADGEFQLRVLDSLAGNGPLLDKYHGLYAEYRSMLRTFADTRAEIDRTRADADYIRYQLDELNRLNPVAGEDTDLAERRDALAASEAVARAISESGRCLAWSDSSAIELIDTALEALQGAADLSGEMAALANRLEAVRSETDSIAEALRSASESVAGSPAAVAEIDNRLDRLNVLMNRHRVDSAAALAAVRDKLAERLESLDDAETTLSDLEAGARSLKRRALETATELSQRRKAAAADLAQRLAVEARPLGLNNLAVDISVTTGKLNADGIDTVDFLFAFNKNQTPRSIGDTASGGEISRVMLTLKAILADKVNLPTIIFDEIDTGVSGDVAARMGRMMKRISADMQVIAITHLPSVAACGETHFRVYKADTDDTTNTHIARLGDDERLHELAAMLGGRADDPAALAAAKSLFDTTNGI